MGKIKQLHIDCAPGQRCRSDQPETCYPQGEVWSPPEALN